METFLIEMLLRGTLSSLDPNNVVVDPKQTYYESCQTGVGKYLVHRYPHTKAREILAVVKKDCDDLMDFIYRTNVWANLRDPAFEGCIDGLKMNGIKGTGSEVAFAQKRFCGRSE